MNVLISSLIAAVAWCQATAATNVRELTADSVGYSELVRVVGQWELAVEAKDPHKLAGFTWPEYQTEVLDELQSNGSVLFNLLLSDTGVLQKLVGTNGVRMRIFEKDTVHKVRSFAVCLYTDDDPPRWPKDFVALIDLKQPGVFCTYWVSEDEGTFVSYSFGLGE